MSIIVAEDQKTQSPALAASGLCYAYGDHRALNDLSLTIPSGQIFALLGPNGSGKTTLFRLISTLAPMQRGNLEILGFSASDAQAEIRRRLGVVFQSPSLDPKLSARENMHCQATLYGITGRSLRQRVDEVTSMLGVADRLDDRCDTLSGGLKRRVELAKCLIHQPPLLLLDEPSTGLDPASRIDLWHALQELQRARNATIVLTTHLLEEADKADQIGILDAGQCVAHGTPQELRSGLGEQVLSIESDSLDSVEAWLSVRSLDSQRLDGQLRVTSEKAASVVQPLSEAFGDQIQTLTLGQPSLEDVFIARTGHQFWRNDGAAHE